MVICAALGARHERGITYLVERGLGSFLLEAGKMHGSANAAYGGIVKLASIDNECFEVLAVEIRLYLFATSLVEGLDHEVELGNSGRHGGERRRWRGNNRDRGRVGYAPTMPTAQAH